MNPCTNPTVLSRRAKRFCRDVCELNSHYHPYVVVVSGKKSHVGPMLVGRGYHWETKGGRDVRHPSAYSKKGWSNLVYCHSTLRVEVGNKWLEANGFSPGAFTCKGLGKTNCQKVCIVNV
jgi:hypothetical protein